jgi:hypothetical protein
VLALLAVGLIVAVAKPWDVLSPPPSNSGRDGPVIPASTPQPGPTAGPGDWTDLSPRVACLAGSTWTAVVDQVDGPTASRAWTRLEVAPATGPTDPGIVRVKVYAAFVPRIGFCAPIGTGASGDGDGTPVVGAGAAPFGVRAWRLVPAAGAPGSWTAVEIHPAPVPDGTPADRGALYLPPSPSLRRAGIAPSPGAPPSPGTPAAPSPGTTSTARDGTPSMPAGWAPDGESWPAATYVFRVELLGTDPGGPAVTWFAIDLRGPWTGPSDAPGSAPASPAPTKGTTPGSSPAL